MQKFILEETDEKLSDKELMAARAEMAKIVRHPNWDRVSIWYELSKTVMQRAGLKKYSNAFYKALELYSLVDEKKIRHFDNASMPGDFIRAAQSKFGEGYDWRASALVGGLDDRYGLLKDNPSRYIMCEGMNGDLTDMKNVEQFPKLLGEWRPNLYTSDLGFQFTHDKLEEDQQLAGNRGQIMAGLLILEPGGTMITKQFTMFRPETRWMMHVLRKLFTSVRLVKPEMSKADNSEVYVVATGYKPDKDILETFHKMPADNSVKAFVGVQVLVDRQAAKMIKNIEMFKKHQKVDYTRQADAWIVRYMC